MSAASGTCAAAQRVVNGSVVCRPKAQASGRGRHTGRSTGCRRARRCRALAVVRGTCCHGAGLLLRGAVHGARPDDDSWRRGLAIEGRHSYAGLRHDLDACTDRRARDGAWRPVTRLARVNRTRRGTRARECLRRADWLGCRHSGRVHRRRSGAEAAVHLRGTSACDRLHANAGLGPGSRCDRRHATLLPLKDALCLGALGLEAFAWARGWALITHKRRSHDGGILIGR